MRRTTGWLATVGLVVSCAAPDVGSIGLEASQPGPWSVPSDTRAIADAQYVAYDGAGPWVGESGCGGSLLAGTAELRYYLLASFEQISGIGGYSCRRNTGDTSRMSVHGTGRALDIFIPLDGSSADNDAGDEVANWLIEHTEEIGVQYVIWDQWQWVSSRASGDKDRMYTGPHPHHDHLHIEITEEAANRRTAWFSGPMAPPASEPTLPTSCDAGTPYDPQFCDDDGHWAESPINYLHDNGLTFGCGEVNGKPRFCPEDTATRGQAIVFIARASEMPTSGHPNAFDDDDGHFAENALNAAATYGIINGCSDRMACPDDDATRSHVATFLVRTFRLPAATRDHFDDDEGSIFENAHNRLAESGITSGCGPREFCGNEVVTRAMMAAFVTRVHSRGLPTPWSPAAEPPPVEEEDPVTPEDPEPEAEADAGTDPDPDPDDAGPPSTGRDGGATSLDAGRDPGGVEGGCSVSGRGAGSLAAVFLMMATFRRRSRLH